MREVLEVVTEETRRVATELLRLRYWQHLVNEALKQKRFTVPVHTAFGHEALAVAVSNAMGEADQLVCTHRNLEYNLARAGALRPVWDELLQSQSGLAGGVMGSMNLHNPARGLVYSSSILGNNLPVACGLALGQQMRGTEGVVFVLTGDGGLEEGAFWESLDFAQSHQLRVVFLIENNDMSMSSTIRERRCPIDIGQVASGFGVPYEPLAGNDVFRYLATLRKAREWVLAHQKPMCLEATIKGYSQHAGPTPGWPADPKVVRLEDGLVIEKSEGDPAWVLQAGLPPGMFDEIATRVMREGGIA